jgi:hypothetical protein
VRGRPYANAPKGRPAAAILGGPRCSGLCVLVDLIDALREGRDSYRDPYQSDIYNERRCYAYNGMQYCR